MQSISHVEVLQTLRAWQSGALSEHQVHNWAGDRYAVDAYEPETEACNAVLAHLDCMDMNLLTVDDIPSLIEALYASDYESVLASLSDATIINRRRNELKSHPFYSPFCG